jgi:hypothetical protein
MSLLMLIVMLMALLYLLPPVAVFHLCALYSSWIVVIGKTEGELHHRVFIKTRDFLSKSFFLHSFLF